MDDKNASFYLVYTQAENNVVNLLSAVHLLRTMISDTEKNNIDCVCALLIIEPASSLCQKSSCKTNDTSIIVFFCDIKVQSTYRNILI